MKILLVNSSCKVGGVSTFLLSLGFQLTASNHQCEMFFFEHGPMEAHLPPDRPIHFGGLADCLRLVDKGGFQAVHANNVDWFTGLTAVRALGARLILTAHKVREPAWTHGWTSRNCDELVTVSRWIRDGLQPYTDAPIRVVHNGIDTGRFSPGEETPTSQPIVAWVGRGAAPRKRLDAFAAVAPALRARGCRVWVIDQQGPATFGEAFPAEARTLADAAELWRGVPYEAMPDAYRQIAASGGCVVSTASMEGLPLTLLEAQACGCAVVAADVLGVNECVSPEHGGVLYEYGIEPAGLTRLILETLADRRALERKQKEAAAYVRSQFSLERMTERYLALYRGTAPAVEVKEALPRGSRRRLSPLFNWGNYVDQRLGVGYEQLQASRTLAAAREWRLAAAAARAGLASAPTMYLRPGRLAHLVRVHLPLKRARTATRATW